MGSLPLSNSAASRALRAQRAEWGNLKQSAEPRMTGMSQKCLPFPLQEVLLSEILWGFEGNYKPRESKDQTLPKGSRESFISIILKTILCMVLDFQGKSKTIYREIEQIPEFASGILQRSWGGDFGIHPHDVDAFPKKLKSLKNRV